MIYDAEHFFDAYGDDPEYALACLRAAAHAGAETIVCCDTNGGTMPHQLGGDAEVVQALSADRRQVGIHTHDDAGCAVANTLAAFERGHARAGHAQRLRRAVWQRQPDHDHPEPPAQARLRLRDRSAVAVVEPARTTSPNC